MTLTDAGPLVALVDKRQKRHEICIATLPMLSAPMLAPWPCFTEAMYLLYTIGGWPMQCLLWRYVRSGALTLYAPSALEIIRAEALMEKYRDTPMDLADAVLVATAETLDLRQVFTLDSHFYAYRTAEGKAFDVAP